MRQFNANEFNFFCSVYIHQVRGYGRTLAVTTLFTADVQNDFNADDCPADIVDKEYTMADIKFLWTYKKGEINSSNLSVI